MIGLFYFALAVLASPFRSKLRLEAENCVPRASGTSLLHRPHPGRMALSNGWSDRSDVNVWTTSSSWARHICAEFWKTMRTITMVWERIGL